MDKDNKTERGNLNKSRKDRDPRATASESVAKEIEMRFGSNQSKRDEGDKRRPKSGKGV